MPPRTIRLIAQAFPDRPAFDTAVSRAILQRVARQEEPETLRFYRPGPTMSFGVQDLRAPGYRAAATAARAAGYEPLLRLAGGRAAAYDDGTIAFAWAIPDPDARSRIHERYQELADIIVVALRSLGVDARVGEIPGEYCPGAYSVNAGGKTKLIGLGQRIVTGAVHVGGFVVVGGSRRIREVLVPVYAALGLPWDPKTVGSIEDEAPSTSPPAVERALREELARRYALVDGTLATESLALAEHFLPAHRLE